MVRKRIQFVTVAGTVCFGVAALSAVASDSKASPPTKVTGVRPPAVSCDPPPSANTPLRIAAYYVKRLEDNASSEEICWTIREKREALARRATYDSLAALRERARLPRCMDDWPYECDVLTRVTTSLALALSGSPISFRDALEFKPSGDLWGWVRSLDSSGPECDSALKRCPRGEFEVLKACQLETARHEPCTTSQLGRFVERMSTDAAASQRVWVRWLASNLPLSQFSLPTSFDALESDLWTEHGEVGRSIERYNAVLATSASRPSPPDVTLDTPKHIAGTSLTVEDGCNLTEWEETSAQGKKLPFLRLTCVVVNDSATVAAHDCQCLVYNVQGDPVDTQAADPLRVPAKGRGMLRADIFGVSEDGVGYVEVSCE